jgi:uncharacterized cupin superfamily protein
LVKEVVMAGRHPQVVNVDEVPALEGAKVFGRSAEEMGGFGGRMRRLGAAAGGKGIGCSFYEIDPGKTAFPFHWHLANEEALLVVSGTGTLRLGGEEIAIRAGDYVALLVGLDHAHQLTNTGNDVLRYYCLSTMNDPEVCGYPDSKKIGTLSMKGAMRFVFREEDTRDYYDREPKYGGKK